MSLHVDDIAQVCHEANRALQLILNNPNNPVSPHWVECTSEMRQSAIEGVLTAQSGATPEELHESWREHKLSLGWRYGPVKDETEKTHPCLVDFWLLPDAELLKDELFRYIVFALS